MLKLAENINDATSRPYEGHPAGTILRLHNNGIDIFLNFLKKVNLQGISLSIPEGSFIQILHSGEYFPVSGECVPIFSHGKQSGIAFTFRNISEVSLQKRFFDLAIEQSSIYPWQYNIEKKEFNFSIGFSKRIGFNEDRHVLRKELDERVHPDDLEQVSMQFDLVSDGKILNTHLNFRLLNAKEHYEWWELRVSALTGIAENTPYNIVGVSQSVQRYKTTEEELITARDRALQADKLKSAFLANMSHEIRTPLNAIVGFSDLLKDIHSFSEEEVELFVTTINKNCDLLLSLINDILDLSRVESGRMEFQFSEYHLPVIMQEIYESHRLNMPEGVEMILKIPEGSDRIISTDPVRLKQVINNLINNAAKFTKEGHIIFGYSEDEPHHTSFFVEDTGKGISKEEQERIFERFYKVDSFTQGVGLGLSICQTIVGRLKGTISVKSEEDKGTRFNVRIPNKVQ